jgi:acyl-CoA reductase-like NAD-dependent aldehyde dehydrogenase
LRLSSGSSPRQFAKGAKVLTGGSRKGLFFEPTLMTGATPGMEAFDEERFDPVAVITTFRNDEEALTLANTTDYGLAAAVVSADLARARTMVNTSVRRIPLLPRTNSFVPTSSSRS